MTQQCHYWAYTLRKPNEKDTWTPLFIAALFAIAGTWKQPRCPSTDEWIKKFLHIYNGILLSHKKEDISVNSNEVNEWRTYYIQWNKSEREKQILYISKNQFSSVQLLSRVRLLATPWIAAHQASLSITNSRSSLRLTYIKSVMPSSHLILCRPLPPMPQIPPSTRVFSNESTLRMRWPKYWSFSFSIIPFKEIPGLITFRMDWWISWQSKRLSRVFSNTTVQKHQFFGT